LGSVPNLGPGIRLNPPTGVFIKRLSKKGKGKSKEEVALRGRGVFSCGTGTNFRPMANRTRKRLDNAKGLKAANLKDASEGH